MVSQSIILGIRGSGSWKQKSERNVTKNNYIKITKYYENKQLLKSTLQQWTKMWFWVEGRSY